MMGWFAANSEVIRTAVYDLLKRTRATQKWRKLRGAAWEIEAGAGAAYLRWLVAVDQRKSRHSGAADFANRHTDPHFIGLLWAPVAK